MKVSKTVKAIKSKNKRSSSTKTPSKNKVGRPTDYRPEYCQGIIQHSKSLGNTLASYAIKLDVTYETLNEWARVHKEFSVAKKKAKAIQEHLMFGLGMKGIQNKISYFGHSTYIFMMKARFGWNENGPMEQDDDNELEFDHDDE